MGKAARRAASLAGALGAAPVSRPTAIVIGGGLAGLSASVALAQHGWQVTLLESKQRLGGRAGSFRDPATGELIDACQHVSMGCCTRFAEFCRTVGIDPLLAPQKSLYFMTPDRRVSRFSADPLPAPLHLARSFLGAHFLTLGEKWRIAVALHRLVKEPAESDGSFAEWLAARKQTRRIIDRFWSVVLVSALNAPIDRIGLKYARKVFLDAFWRDRRGFDVQIPVVPLDRLYGEELRSWFDRHDVAIQLSSSVAALTFRARRVESVMLRNGKRLTADALISAVPPDRLLALLPTELAAEPAFTDLRRFEFAPITSVHLWFDRPATDLPHVVFVDCLSQWLFQRGGNYIQVVVSAAHELAGLSTEQIEERVVAELTDLFPNLVGAQRLRSKVVTERAATFSPVPGVDQWRPGATTPVANLFLAGDWTATNWPATMESAVISGENAASAATRSLRSGAR